MLSFLRHSSWRPHEQEPNDRIIEEFRANEGKWAGAFAGASLLLLTTTG